MLVRTSVSLRHIGGRFQTWGESKVGTQHFPASGMCAIGDRGERAPFLFVFQGPILRFLALCQAWPERVGRTATPPVQVRLGAQGGGAARAARIPHQRDLHPILAWGQFWSVRSTNGSKPVRNVLRETARILLPDKMSASTVARPLFFVSIISKRDIRVPRQQRPSSHCIATVPGSKSPTGASHLGHLPSPQADVRRWLQRGKARDASALASFERVGPCQQRATLWWNPLLSPSPLHSNLRPQTTLPN